VSPDKNLYLEENIQFHVNNKLHWLIEIKKIPLEELEGHFDFPIYAIDKFTLTNESDGKLFKKERIYEKQNVF